MLAGDNDGRRERRSYVDGKIESSDGRDGRTNTAECFFFFWSRLGVTGRSSGEDDSLAVWTDWQRGGGGETRTGLIRDSSDVLPEESLSLVCSQSLQQRALWAAKHTCQDKSLQSAVISTSS